MFCLRAESCFTPGNQTFQGGAVGFVMYASFRRKADLCTKPSNYGFCWHDCLGCQRELWWCVLAEGFNYHSDGANTFLKPFPASPNLSYRMVFYSYTWTEYFQLLLFCRLTSQWQSEVFSVTYPICSSSRHRLLITVLQKVHPLTIL